MGIRGRSVGNYIINSLHETEGWHGQWKRVCRWHQRMKASQQSKDYELFLDFTFAYFQNAFCFKDWLVSGGVIKNSNANEFINASVEMKLCRDICNGTKHWGMTKPSLDADFSILWEYMGKGKPHKACVIASGSPKYGIVELADKCQGLWEEFLHKYRLLPQPHK